MKGESRSALSDTIGRLLEENHSEGEEIGLATPVKISLRAIATFARIVEIQDVSRYITITLPISMHSISS